MRKALTITALLLISCGESPQTIVTDAQVEFAEAWFKKTLKLEPGWARDVEIRYGTEEEVMALCKVTLRHAYTGCTAPDASYIIIVPNPRECEDVLHELGHVAGWRLWHDIDWSHFRLQNWYLQNFNEPCGVN